ncbi:glycosyltransferase [Aurantimonas sp. MSK8Z-1]|uniref:glycosyltransferase family 2 protein n=1 Tax=Mangrovibrevibacter kandeliae TaxID=2968473 RepID=UPI002117C176|nr:glycosyltransferase [Aurantimonas sp. MSK8Z-1]MCW4116419.1 glycosyltransferase [Aurantimonas sp. MSK8Z-1]
MQEAITIEVRTPRLREPEPRVVVTLPTFRRPEHLRRTLQSLAVQATDRPFAVVVMENEAEAREGLAAARSLIEAATPRGLVLVAHARGNCSAYNAGWATALAEFPAMEHLLVIDDDEVAPPDWIARLVAAAEATGADLVGGPQLPDFETPSGARYRRHPVFTPHYDTTGPVPILYSSGNVLIRRRVLEAMGPPFLDTAFNFVGGGDSDFYTRCRAKGFRFAWCAEAPVYETVPARRTEFSWINARSLRNGSLSAMIEARSNPGQTARLRRLAKSAALLAASAPRGIALGWRTGSPVAGLYHLQVALGRFLGEFGKINEQYRRPEQN